ncbi:hypothetical protein [Cupriavidus oxalaticus]|uniref:Uncharacterized protein n=1 Tax=Cupriavidus oxalaticus TaxID=96344 RepID=A0A375G4Z8_9BURK|nr:hypothetical protein [Cupriavidus oxalaticus]QRQ88490.1 hypothetical protein JTE91_18125 [Cupriavidus oxalaticus]QRQ93184.1 hypothetical protein JTE92_24135 [Cupriavidus oxalaticus]WQD81795.1 hypothetical protein U0036_11870 [Cupriavidus oxalaticus]SPC13168.1 conserved hypothetical protein [Cupriavidus oxalaticus]
MEHLVTFHIDTEQLQSYNDSHLASLWHIAQANPAPLNDHGAGALAEAIGREIIRRWLRWAGAPLWDRQGNHHYWDALKAHCQWDGERWVPKVQEAAADASANTSQEVQ